MFAIIQDKVIGSKVDLIEAIVDGIIADFSSTRFEGCFLFEGSQIIPKLLVWANLIIHFGDMIRNVARLLAITTFVSGYDPFMHKTILLPLSNKMKEIAGYRA